MAPEVEAIVLEMRAFELARKHVEPAPSESAVYWKRWERGVAMELTLRASIADYNLLRAEAFVRDWSINEALLDAIRAVIEGERREVLDEVLARARSAGSVRGRGRAQPPFKLHRKCSRATHLRRETQIGSNRRQTDRFQRSKTRRSSSPEFLLDGDGYYACDWPFSSVSGWAPAAGATAVLIALQIGIDFVNKGNPKKSRRTGKMNIVALSVQAVCETLLATGTQALAGSLS